MGLVETLVNGLLVGGIYGLLALGLALAFGIMRIVNVAHGEIIVLAAFAGLFLTHSLGINPFLAIPIVAAVFFAAGYGLQGYVLNRLVGRNPLPPLLATFGLSTMLRNLMVEGYGADIHRIDAGNLPFLSFSVGSAHIGVLGVLLLGIAVVTFAVLAIFFAKTAFGRIVRATADDHTMVQLQGVYYRRVYSLVMGLAFAVTALSGILLAMRSTFTPFSGIENLLIAFEVVIIGGLGSLWGPLIAGLAMGVVHLIGLRFDPNSGLLYPHLLFFVILLSRPEGLFGLRR
jgi:branched-chain amino acid transport system permease protein